MKFTSTPNYSLYKHNDNHQQPLVWGFTRSFFFGITAALGALFLEIFFGMIINSPQVLTDIFFNQVTPFLVLAVLTEEILKFTFIYKRRSELKIYFQNIGTQKVIKKEIFFNSFFIGIGFSFIELLFVFFSLPSLGDTLNLKMAILGILIIHTATSSIMGYLLAKYETVIFSLILMTLLITTTAHLFYNSLLIYSAQPFFILFYLIVFCLILVTMIFRLFLEDTKK
ncbi:MAG TPA: hypothetical protein VF390_00825 [Patescibacteria group bacterium]